MWFVTGHFTPRAPTAHSRTPTAHARTHRIDQVFRYPEDLPLSVLSWTLLLSVPGFRVCGVCVLACVGVCVY
jgi:hypothetical protein